MAGREELCRREIFPHTLLRKRSHLGRMATKAHSQTAQKPHEARSAHPFKYNRPTVTRPTVHVASAPGGVQNTTSHLGIEPRTFGLEVQRAILCANGTAVDCVSL